MILKVCAIAVFAAILYALLDNLGVRSKGLFGTLCALMILSALGDSLGGLLSSMLSIAENTGISEAASCALRTVGLGYVFGFTSDFCAELGEGVIAKAVSVVGKIQIFLVAYPYFEKTVALGIGLLE